MLTTYADAQLMGLRVALLAAAAIALASLFLTRNLPAVRLAGPAVDASAPAGPAAQPVAPQR